MVTGLARGDRLGPYEILEPIGKGGMGEVYKASDTRPRWSDTGRELFYMDQSGRLMAVGIKAGARIDASVPKALFETGLVNTLIDFDVYRGGQRFVMATPEHGRRTAGFRGPELDRAVE